MLRATNLKKTTKKLSISLINLLRAIIQLTIIIITSKWSEATLRNENRTLGNFKTN